MERLFMRISIKADYWLETCCGIGPQWLVAERAQAWCQRCGTNICGKVFGFIWILGTVCVCAQHPRIGMSQRSTMRPEIDSNDFGRGFGINQQIRIRFSSSRKIFLNHSNFWCVQSSITLTVAVHVHVLWLVCTHTIPFRMLWCL